MFMEATQDLGDVKRKIMLNMLEVVKFYPNQSRGGCTIEMKDGKKICVTDIYDALAKRTLIAQNAR
mgnify:FL=1